MGIIGKIFKSKFVKRVVLGLGDSIPVLPRVNSNIQSEDNKGGKGKIDFLRLAVALIASLTVWAYLTGRIENVEDVTQLFKFVINLFKIIS